VCEYAQFIISFIPAHLHVTSLHLVSTWLDVQPLPCAASTPLTLNETVNGVHHAYWLVSLQLCEGRMHLMCDCRTRIQSTARLNEKHTEHYVTLAQV